jgi:hypothetical protein
MKTTHYCQIALLVLITGCSAYGYERYTISGARTDFCLPSKNTVPKIPWVPADKPNTPKDFAFQGCWNADPAVKPTCSVPLLRGAVVSPLSTARSYRWQDIASDAQMRAMVALPTTILDVSNNGLTFMVSNPKLSLQWYVWHKANPLAPGQKPQLDDNDVMVAACSAAEVSMPHSYNTRHTVSCNRFVRGPDYFLNYQFETNEKAPDNLGLLDASVIAMLDGWRCPKKR